MNATERAALRAVAERVKAMPPDMWGAAPSVTISPTTLLRFLDALEAAEQQVAELRKEKDAAYAERNKVVMALAYHYPCRWGIDADEPDWRVLYIELPTGQVSWHFSLAEYEAARGLNALAHNGVWDGHTTEEKYKRLAALQEVQP